MASKINLVSTINKQSHTMYRSGFGIKTNGADTSTNSVAMESYVIYFVSFNFCARFVDSYCKFST